jgi:rhodanese-related sulfurtransferase
MAVKSITPIEVYQLHLKSEAIVVIDVREAHELVEVSTPLAQHLPLTSFAPSELMGKYSPETPLFMLCRSGVRSRKAAELLIQVGFSVVYNIEGGIIDWEASGLPVKKK